MTDLHGSPRAVPLEVLGPAAPYGASGGVIRADMRKCLCRRGEAEIVFGYEQGRDPHSDC